MFEKQTYNVEELLINVTTLHAYDPDRFKVETLRSIVLGRCYTITPLKPVKKQIPTLLPVTKTVDLTGLFIQYALV
jgi:hypothetical protein